MKLEIIKEINLTGIGLKKVGDLIDIADNQGNTLVRMRFGKVSEISNEDAEVIAEIEAEEANETKKIEKQKRTRRTKAEIEANKKR